MSVREKVLHALLENNNFISGEQLSDELGVSRTSVWKAIKKLKEDGFNIESVNNKGYKMIDNPDGLVESLLQHDLLAKGYEVVKLYDSIDSTNLEAKRLADTFNGKGLFIAKEQTLGKGRRGRKWQSPKGTGNYMSYILRPDIEPQAASMLTLIAGLAVCKSMVDLYEIDVRIKWPNDIVIGGKKLCGILTELSAEIDYVNYVVVGIGINVYQQHFDEEIKDIATSLVLEVDTDSFELSKHQLILKITDYMNSYLEVFNKTNTLEFIKDEYESLCVNVSGQVRIESKLNSYIAVGQGITSTGQLLVLNEEGQLIEVNSGEVSVRGIYGYV